MIILYHKVQGEAGHACEGRMTSEKGSTEVNGTDSTRSMGHAHTEEAQPPRMKFDWLMG